MTCADECLLCADLALRDDAAKLGLVCKVGGIDDLGNQLEKLCALLVKSRAVNNDISLRLTADGRCGNRVEGEISELGEQLVLEAADRVILGFYVLEERRERGKKQKLICREIRRVKVEVEICDSRGGKGEAVAGGARNLLEVGGNALCLGIDIGCRESGKSSDSLGRILASLPSLECGGLLGDASKLVCGHLRLDLGKVSRNLCLASLTESLGGNEKKLDGRVLDEHLVKKLLKVALVDARAELCKGVGQVKACGGISVPKPGVKHGKTEDQTLGHRAVVTLAVLEFRRVEKCVETILIKTVFVNFS